MRSFALLLLALLPGVTAAQPAAAQTPAPAVPQPPALAMSRDAPFVVPRLTGPVSVDGRVDEAAWKAVAPLPLVTHWPAFGGAPSEKTEIRIAYDDAAVYVSCRCDAPPDAIAATSFARDASGLGTDYLALQLDTYDDNASSMVFLTTPTGTRTDVATSGDTGVFDDTWNTFWDAAAVMTPTGWAAEMRIPFSSLRFQTVDGRTVMGLGAWRYLARRNELDIFPAIPPEWGFWSFGKPTQFQQATFTGVEASRPVYVTPYALGGGAQRFDTAALRSDTRVTEMGADAKLALTDDLGLDLTLNTDFAQVEADAPQLNLTRFSLFFPERRQFFLERASVFDVGFGGSDRLFYSRRIGLADGEPVRILGGGRVVGRLGAFDVGTLVMQTARRTTLDETGAADVLPSETFGVVRLQRRAFNDQSRVGAMTTSRVGVDGSASGALGLDADVRLFGQTFLVAAAAATLDDQSTFAPLDASRLRATLERRSNVGTAYVLTAARAGRAYRPAVGFQQRKDFTSLAASVSQGWAPPPGSRLSRHRALVSLETFLRNADGVAETSEGRAEWAGSFASGATLTVAATATRDNLLDGFSLSSDATVPAGSYTFGGANLSYGLPGGQAATASLRAGGGMFYDGWRAVAGIDPRWLVSRPLGFSGGYEVNVVGFPDRRERFVAHVGRLRVTAALDTRWSMAATVQANSAAQAGLVNARFRYNPREGTDLYLVFNAGHTDPGIGASGRPFADSRGVLIKYATTFAL